MSTNCPHCGAEFLKEGTSLIFWGCGTSSIKGTDRYQRPALCFQRSALQQEEAAHAETKRQLSELKDDLTAKSERIALLKWRYEVQLKAAETAEKGAKDAEQQLTAARAEVERLEKRWQSLRRWVGERHEYTFGRRCSEQMKRLEESQKADPAPAQKGGAA